MTTDTDRELLELAAKAAGIQLDFSIRGDFPPYYVNERGGHSSWNPLTDDGDALRLAVALGLVVDCSRPSAALPFTRHDYSLSEGGNNAAATRRAIVRAAAEIGRGME